MEKYISLAQIDEATQAVQKKITIKPKVGIILGSGLNALADSVQNAVYIPYSEIPYFPTSTVFGHIGRFVIGQLEG
ncbi:MAG: purine-nucleoside phosphorylase, partial [Anaerolineales bacterium]|nr:purine-nucleoside phosphorylase [Anaerolineales bacterium]